MTIEQYCSGVVYLWLLNGKALSLYFHRTRVRASFDWEKFIFLTCILYFLILISSPWAVRRNGIAKDDSRGGRVFKKFGENPISPYFFSLKNYLFWRNLSGGKGGGGVAPCPHPATPLITRIWMSDLENVIKSRLGGSSFSTYLQ